MQDFKFSRCPRTKTARIVVQNELSDPPQLIVIHTGTNSLTRILRWRPRLMLSFRISLLWSQKLRESSLWVKSSTLLFFHEQIYHRISLAKLTNKLPMVALNYQTCILSLMKIFSPRNQLTYMMTDTLKKRHLGLFAANLTDAIRRRAKPTRSPTNHLFRSPHRSQSPATSEIFIFIQWRRQDVSLETTINQHTNTSSNRRRRRRRRRRLFPFRKQAMPFLTVDAIISNQAFSIADVIVRSGLCCNKVISNFFKSS